MLKRFRRGVYYARLKVHRALAYLYLKDANKCLDKGDIYKALKYTDLVGEHTRKVTEALSDYMKTFAEG